jgi:hypothetical protein
MHETVVHVASIISFWEEYYILLLNFTLEWGTAYYPNKELKPRASEKNALKRNE